MCARWVSALNRRHNGPNGKLWGGVNSPGGQGFYSFSLSFLHASPHWDSEFRRACGVDVGGLNYGLVMGKSNECAEPDLLFPPCSQGAERTAEPMVLGWNPWSVWNTRPPRFSKNHWHLEKGPTPAQLVGSRSVITLRHCLPQPQTLWGIFHCCQLYPSQPWTDPGHAPLHCEASASPVAVEWLWENLRALTSRAPVRWGACHWAGSGRWASRSPDDWGGDHRAVGARTSLPQRVGAVRMRGNYRSRHVWSCRSLFCWKLWVGFTVTHSFWLRSPWTSRKLGQGLRKEILTGELMY